MQINNIKAGLKKIQSGDKDDHKLTMEEYDHIDVIDKEGENESNDQMEPNWYIQPTKNNLCIGETTTSSESLPKKKTLPLTKQSNFEIYIWWFNLSNEIFIG